MTIDASIKRTGDNSIANKQMIAEQANGVTFLARYSATQSVERLGCRLDVNYDGAD